MIEVNEYLNTRAVNVLHNAGIFTDEDLLKVNRKYLLSLSNCGRKTLNRICCYVESFGSCLPYNEDTYLIRKLENWIDILNYWEDEVKEVAERYDDMWNMYKKYDKMIEEMYNLIKELKNADTRCIKRQGFIYHK